MSNNSPKLITKTAFVFPGQGSQAIGMLSEFEGHQSVSDTFEEASEALGYNLWELCQNGPAEQLNQTDKTQPALLASSVALWRLWSEKAELPSLLAGHSLGEYSALVCANKLGFADAIKLVEQRGLYMQEAVPAGVGKMAAIIGLDDANVVEACNVSAESEVVSPVNYNSPGQIVIAGNADAVERAMAACKERGAKKAMPLAVSVPSHCMLMKPASEKLAEALANINISESEFSVVNNVDVKIETTADAIKDALVRQLYCPVRWVESVALLSSMGVEHLVECGPGKVLSGLNRRIDRALNSHQINQLNQLNQSVESLS